MVKINRSYPAPESLSIEALKTNGSYREKDVIERLKKDFYDKCYICELKGLQDPEVEHLLSHKNGFFLEHKFDWNNLFWCCGHCNKVKNNTKYDAGIIDCCNQDPEELLLFSLIDDNVSVMAVNPADNKSSLTATLIYEVFNLRNTGIRESACENRMQSLRLSMNVLYRELERYKKSPSNKRNNRIMSALLSRESAFAAFKRGYVRSKLSEFPDLEKYVI